MAATTTSATAAAAFSLPSAPRRVPRRRSLLRAASTAAPPSPDLSIQLSPRPSPPVSANGAATADPPVAAFFARDRAEDLQAEARAMARAAGATVYSPELLASRYGSRPLKVALRAAEVLSKLGAFGLKLLLDERRGDSSSAKRRARAVELRTILTRLGPTFVKIGQGLSTRPDLCPTEYLEELSELQDSLPTFPDEEAFACIERELSFPLDSVYSAISPSPMAAASLGQVYKARLKYSGNLVAVKVQRPGIEDAIGLDFYLLRGLGFLINKYVDIVSSDVVALMDEFARRVFQELNYVQEGQNARRFKKLYADKQDILVPDIFWDYTSAKVLTMEWIEGVKLNQQAAIESQGLKVLDLVNIGIQCSLRQLLEYGYFHADPHPGNILATPEGKLAFLDFGMMSETPEDARVAIIGHVVHLVNRDYEAMARDYYALDFLEPDVDVSPIVPALKNFFDGALNATVSELNFKTIVDGLGAVLYRYPFNVPAYYALILRSLTVLEGLALYADPNFKVLAASYPYFAKRLLTDPNPYLRDALIELLFKDGKFRWNRLENLLVQGRQDREFAAKDALQPVLKLLLGPDGEELRLLVVKEAVRVTEAITIGALIDSYNAAPEFLKPLISNGNPGGTFKLSDVEREQMIELRDRVFRIWGLLRSSDNFDPSLLQPIVQVLQEPEARVLGSRVAGGVTQRLAARLLQQLLRTPPVLGSSQLIGSN
ncbi:protein ACTIVITY OF BC1 COMPLEX KINASE 3, chloroplastic-like isoform X2 [Phragmites australis]|uniref:protein ACTIVITY OF BC1 COMPLEX KINASE 3, chloroplastic-like isoform X2 n=1 Tax=Phragmites australis TaxID=29695 RepID=UPI002D7697EE|nr:protein ACTIVITY OF BC1 COMPLEX KINASE 3, chloroplastic-like isoform X2 [Phragmites australis]